MQLMILTLLLLPWEKKKKPHPQEKTEKKKYKGQVEINVYMHLLRRTVPLFKGIRALWRNVESLTKEKKLEIEENLLKYKEIERMRKKQ